MSPEIPAAAVSFGVIPTLCQELSVMTTGACATPTTDPYYCLAAVSASLPQVQSLMTTEAVGSK